MRLGDVGELGLLAELERRGLAVRIENDAAQLPGGWVVTQDALVEDVHFRLDWISWRNLGFRAAAVNLSDLAASGAEPEGLVVTLAAPSDTAVADVVELYEGLGEAGVPVIGGDTTSADRLMLSVTAIGRSERVPGRAGARPGDVLVVTGPLGAGGAAFRSRAATRGRPSASGGATSSRPPRTRCSTSPTALPRDAGHIAGRSGCRLVIDLERVPLADGAELDDLGFGEDYELLAARPGSNRRLHRDRPLRGRRGRRAARRRPPGRPRRLRAFPPVSSELDLFGVRPQPGAELLLEVTARTRAHHGPLCSFRPRRGSPSAATEPRSSAALSGCSSMLTVTNPTRPPCSASSSSSTRADRLARPAPGRPEVDDHRALRREHLGWRRSRPSPRPCRSA